MSKLEKMQGEAGGRRRARGARAARGAIVHGADGENVLQVGWLLGAVTWITGSMDNFKMEFGLQPLNCQILEKILYLNNLPCLQTRSFILVCFPEGRVRVCVCARV